MKHGEVRVEFWKAFTPDAEDWVFNEDEGRHALRGAVEAWLAADTAGIRALGDVLKESGASSEQIVSRITERLMVSGAVIRLEGEFFVEQSLPVLVQFMRAHPDAFSVGEDVLSDTAGMFFCPKPYYPWREMADVLEDPTRSEHARDALAHHFCSDNQEGDDFWALALYTRLASTRLDAEILSRYVARQETVYPPLAILAAEGIARAGMNGIEQMAEMLKSSNRDLRVVGILALGLTGFKEVQPILQAIFELHPPLQPLIAHAWTWTASEDDVGAFHEQLYVRADPGQRNVVGKAWLTVSDPFRCPNPRWEVPWPLHYLPGLPGDETPFPRRELMPLLFDALAGEVDPEEQLSVQTFEDAVGGPSSLDEWSKEWEEATFERFEADGVNYGIPTGTVVPFDKMGTFFLHQRSLILALNEGRGGLPMERIAVEVWENTVEKMLAEELDPDSSEAHDLQMILDTISWGAARGASDLQQLLGLLSRAVIRTMTWVLDDPVQARVIEEQLAREAAELAAE